MSRISDAMVETLLEEIVDYEAVQLSEKEMDSLKDICDRWRDESSIESEINSFIKDLGYSPNRNLLWIKYPFKEGDDYWTIDERGMVVWSCWDETSEDMHDANPSKTYYASEQDAINQTKN
tara:strand:- start:639 stop:1001 length:363 start_codon:yes stop_codon:yes gene_type:complete